MPYPSFRRPRLRTSPPLLAGLLLVLFPLLGSVAAGLEGASAPLGLGAQEATSGLTFTSGESTTSDQSTTSGDSATSGRLAGEVPVPRGMVPEDFHDVVVAGDPQISPDGAWVAFTRTVVSDDRRGRDTQIWMVPTDGSAPARPFTSGNGDRSPRWAPDGGSLAFLRSVEGRTQIFLIPVDGGEARALTRIRQGNLAGIQWRPDGESLVVTLTVNPGIEDPTADTSDSDETGPDTVMVRDAGYRTGPGNWLGPERRTLWLVSAHDGGLTPLVVSPEWNVNQPVLSPDGVWLAFSADTSGEEFDGAFNRDLLLVPMEGGPPEVLATGTGRSSSPLFSPDSRWLVYQHQGERYEPVELHRLPVDGGEPEVLHDGLELTASGLLWPDGWSLPAFTADARGARPLFRLGVDGAASLVTGERASLESPSFDARGRRVAFIRHDEVSPPEVWVAEADGSGGRALTDLNRELLDRLVLSSLHRFTFAHDGGGELVGFVHRPLGFREGGRHPLVLNIKGGPGGMWGHQWFHENQMLAAAGYGVIFVNYRGSTGWGHDFQSAVRLDYGGVDYRDNMALVDEALRRFDWIDPERLFVTGGSHGGFLTNWITTRTDRFRAAVTQRSVSNWISEAGTQAYPPRSMNVEFGGSLWENFDAYWDRSPLRWADRVVTPTLIIHSMDDHITPIGQGQEWFFALKNVGVPVELVMFRGEGHGLSRTGRPVNLVERLNQILRWFDQWNEGHPD